MSFGLLSTQFNPYHRPKLPLPNHRSNLHQHRLHYLPLWLVFILITHIILAFILFIIITIHYLNKPTYAHFNYFSRLF